MNFMISVLGWFLWNWGELEFRKRELDDDGNPNTNFGFKEYREKKWTSWVGSIMCVPVLLWVGYLKLDLKPLEFITGENHGGWNDLYYLGAGCAWEMIIFSIIRINKFFKR